MGHDQLDLMTQSMQCSVVRQYYLCSTVACDGDGVGASSWYAVCLAGGGRTTYVQLMPKFWSGEPGVALQGAYESMGLAGDDLQLRTALLKYVVAETGES